MKNIVKYSEFSYKNKKYGFIKKKYVITAVILKAVVQTTYLFVVPYISASEHFFFRKLLVSLLAAMFLLPVDKKLILFESAHDVLFFKDNIRLCFNIRQLSK